MHSSDKRVYPTGLTWLDHYLQGGLRQGEALFITGKPETYASIVGAMIALHTAHRHIVKIYTDDRSRSHNYLSDLDPDQPESTQFRISTRYLHHVNRAEVAKAEASLVIVDGVDQLREWLCAYPTRHGPAMVVIGKHGRDNFYAGIEFADHTIVTDVEEHEQLGPILEVTLKRTTWCNPVRDANTWRNDSRVWDGRRSGWLQVAGIQPSRAICLDALPATDALRLPTLTSLIRAGGDQVLG